MSKHILDGTRARTGQRTPRYAMLERMRGLKLRPQTAALRQRPKGLSNALRMRRYLEIARQGD